MVKDIEYYKSIQNAHNTTSKKEHDLLKLNTQLNKHFADSIDYEVVLNNGSSQEMIIEKTNNNNVKKIKIRPQENINMGDIIDWCNAKWLVTSIDPDMKTYNRAEITLCTFLLRWQNEDGVLLDRWCVEKDSTDNLDEGKIITTSNSEFNLQLPLDDETKLLRIDKRFLRDVDGIDIPSAYKLTDRNINTDNYQYFNRGGILNITVKGDTYNPNKDDKKLMIADYFSPTVTTPDESGILSYSKIICNNPQNEVVIGSSSFRTLTFTAYEEDGSINTTILPTWTFDWNGMSASDFTIEYAENKVNIKVRKNWDLLGRTFTVNASDGNNKYKGRLELTIVM